MEPGAGARAETHDALADALTDAPDTIAEVITMSDTRAARAPTVAEALRDTPCASPVTL